MRSEKELQRATYPFAVEFVGADDICIRNLEDGNVVGGSREVRATTEPAATEQNQRLESIAVGLATERRSRAVREAPEHTSEESLEQAYARIHGEKTIRAGGLQPQSALETVAHHPV